jgi:vitamin B12 transporter
VYDKSVGNRELKPEQSVNYELGISQDHKNIRNRLVYFYRTIKDGVDFNYVSFKYFNFVKQVVNGLEYELTYLPSEKMNLSFNYTFLSARETTQSRENFRDTVYSYLLRRPKHNINFTAGYQLSENIYASTSFKYLSGRQDVGGYMAKDVSLDSYCFINAYAEYKLKKGSKCFIDLQNITGKQFFDIRGYNAMPFMASAGITVVL